MKNKRKNDLNANATDSLEALNPTVKEDTGSVSSVSASDKGSDFIKAGSVKEDKLPKTVTNVSKVAELVGDVSANSSGTGAPTLRAIGAISFSGGSETIGGDASDMVRATKVTKAGDRPERKLDTAIMHVDDTPAETYTVGIKTIPDLKSPDAIGWNGVYRNDHSITGKASGGSPADNKWFRTVDMIEYDNMYFTHGQQNFVANDANKTITYASYAGNNTYDYTNVTVGNYTNDTLHVEFAQNANTDAWEVSKLRFTSADHSSILDEDGIRLAGDAGLRNANQDELDRLAMVDKAGDENKDNWSPLGVVMRNASANNRVFKMLDSMIGAYVLVSGDKGKKAISFQINKSRKDGVRKVGPMFEMCQGNVDSDAANDHIYNVRLQSYNNENANILKDLFGDNGMIGQYANANGSAALYVAYHDSLAKYNTKGKLLSLPLSFKTAYNSYKQNCGIFRAPVQFMNEYARQEVFGKVDEDGTGITPFFMSDGAKLITPLPLNILGITDATLNGDNKITSPAVHTSGITVHYEDKRNRYNYNVYNYLTAGLLDYFNRHANKMVKFLPSAVNGVVTLNIPITSTVSTISLWDLILMESLPDVVKHRKYAYEIVNKYEEMNGYPYSGVDYIKEFNTPNVGFTDINSTLTTKNVPLSAAVRLLLPETFSVIGDIAQDDLHAGGSGNKYQIAKTILPWYFNQDQFENGVFTNNVHYWKPKFLQGSKMTFFDRRDGVSWNNVDRILAMDPEQLKLNMDRMVMYPGYYRTSIYPSVYPTGETKHFKFDYQYDDVGLNEAYKNAFHEDGIPVVNYKAFASSGGSIEGCLNIDDIISCPRELGLSFIAPEGVVTPTKLATNLGVTYQHYRAYTDGFLSYSGSSFRAKLWAPITENIQNTALSNDQANKSLGSAYTATYYTIYANPYDAGTDIGLIFNINARDTNGRFIIDYVDKPIAGQTGNDNYDPSTGIYASTEQKITYDKESNIGFSSTIKYFWNRLNILPFVVSPFDINNKILSFEHYSSNKWGSSFKYSPYEFINLFNVCGFRCGEYSTREYSRCEARIQRGLGYIEDPYIQYRA
jgi:hypothetical protein